MSKFLLIILTKKKKKIIKPTKKTFISNLPEARFQFIPEQPRKIII